MVNLIKMILCLLCDIINMEKKKGGGYDIIAKLNDDAIFKPQRKTLTPEEERQEEKTMDLFFDMLEKNGITSIIDPSKEISREEMYADIRSGKLTVSDYHDRTGQTDISDYFKKL